MRKVGKEEREEKEGISRLLEEKDAMEIPQRILLKIKVKYRMILSKRG